MIVFYFTQRLKIISLMLKVLEMKTQVKVVLKGLQRKLSKMVFTLILKVRKGFMN
jgi:hypothetical protein